LAITDKDIDTIERYIDGLLSGDDLNNFERRLEKEASIAQQVVSMKALRHSAKASVLQDKMRMLKQLDAGMGEESGDEGEEVGSQVKVRRMPWLRYVAVAAVFMGVLFFGKLWMDGVEEEKLSEKYAGVEFPESPIDRIRSSENSEEISSMKLKAFNIYDLALIELENGNYRDADRYFGEALKLFEDIYSKEKDIEIQEYIELFTK